MIYIIIEPAYKNSTWCNDILSSIIPELCKNKFNYVTACDFNYESCECHSFALILCNTIKWAKRMAKKCLNKHVKPVVLANFDDDKIAFSTVGFDYKYSMNELKKILISQEKTRTAIFALRKNSPANRLMEKYFLETFTNSTIDDVYFRKTSTSDCFADFLQSANKYDSIICSNAHTAVFFANNIKKNNYPIDNMTVISYGDSILLSKSVENSLVVSQPHCICGKTAVTIVKTLIRHPKITNLSCLVECNIYESGKILPVYNDLEYDLDNEMPENEILDTNDTAISEITRIEMFLKNCTPIELTITDMLISKLTYEKTAEICNLSTSTVKYHSKKMFDSLNCSSRKEFEALLDKYNYKA